MEGAFNLLGLADKKLSGGQKEREFLTAGLCRYSWSAFH